MSGFAHVRRFRSIREYCRQYSFILYFWKEKKKSMRNLRKKNPLDAPTTVIYRSEITVPETSFVTVCLPDRSESFQSLTRKNNHLHIPRPALRNPIKIVDNKLEILIKFFFFFYSSFQSNKTISYYRRIYLNNYSIVYNYVSTSISLSSGCVFANR